MNATIQRARRKWTGPREGSSTHSDLSVPRWLYATSPAQLPSIAEWWTSPRLAWVVGGQQQSSEASDKNKCTVRVLILYARKHSKPIVDRFGMFFFLFFSFYLISLNEKIGSKLFDNRLPKWQRHIRPHLPPSSAPTFKVGSKTLLT